MDPPSTPIETLSESLDEMDSRYSVAPYEAESLVGENGVPAKSSSKAKKSREDIRLAERTSEILSNYRAFLQEHDMETGPYKNEITGISSSSHGSATRLLRDWSTDVPFGSDGNSGEKRRYHHVRPVLSSKRAKYGALMSIGLVAVAIVAITATTNGASKNKMPERDNTPGWHKEAGYILNHENGHEDDQLPHYDVLLPKEEEPLPRPEEVPEMTVPEDMIAKVLDEMEASKEAKLITGTGSEATEQAAPVGPAPTEVQASVSNAAATSSLVSFDLSKILHEKFRPLWLGSAEGWNGGSHEEAMEFCANVRGKTLCPYSAMCPLGPGHNVMYGRKPVDFSGDGEQYAPVYGHANRWVMVGQKNGDPATTCMSHEQLERKEPVWGSTGENPEQKMHIMCCNAD